MTSAETRVAVLLTLMRQLQEVMRTENGLLRDLKLARLRELQVEKAALAGHYELELRRLRQAPDTLAGLGEDADACSRAACASSRRRCGRTPTGCCRRARWSRPWCRPSAKASLRRGGHAPRYAPARRPRPTVRRG